MSRRVVVGALVVGVAALGAYVFWPRSEGEQTRRHRPHASPSGSPPGAGSTQASAPSPTPGLGGRPPARLAPPTPDDPMARPAQELPRGYLELVPHHPGASVREVRKVARDTHWLALRWPGQTAVAAAEFYRKGLTEKGWRVLTDRTAKVHLGQLARRGLASGVEGKRVVGKRRGRTAAVLVSTEPGGAAARIEVTLIRVAPPRPR